MDTKQKKYLDYYKDSDGNYILRRIPDYGSEEISCFRFSGSLSCVKLFKEDTMEQKIDEEFNKMANKAEEKARNIYKIDKDSFIFEKIVGNFSDEKKINPLYSKMSEKEADSYRDGTIKVKIVVYFEFHIKIEKHLRLRALKEFFFPKTETSQQ